MEPIPRAFEMCIVCDCCKVISILIAAHVLRDPTMKPHVILHWDKHAAQDMLTTIVKDLNDRGMKAIRKTNNTVVNESDSIIVRVACPRCHKLRIGHLWIIDPTWTNPSITFVQKKVALSIRYGFLYVDNEERKELVEGNALFVKIIGDKWIFPYLIHPSLLAPFESTPDILQWIQTSIVGMGENFKFYIK